MAAVEKKLMQEHRLFVRYPFSAKVVLQAQEGAPRTVLGEVIDVSFRGLGINAEQPFALNSKVSFFIASEGLAGTGRVVYNLQRNNPRRFRTGLEFLEVDSIRIRDLIFRLQQSLGTENPSLG